MARIDLAPTVLLSLAMLSACTPAASKDALTAPISPASVPASGPGKCNPVEFAAALGIPTPAPVDTPLSPRMKEINYRVLACLELSEPEKDAFRRAMPLISRDLQATPAPARPEQRTVPGAGGGAPPPDFLPPTFTPNPRPPEPTATIDLTLPDGSIATATLPPFTATLAPVTATPISQVGIREYTPPLANFTDVLAMPGWSKYPDVIKRLPNNSLQVVTPGTEMRVRNNEDYIEVGNKGFDVRVKMSTVNNNNPAGVVSAIILANRARQPLQIEIGFDNNRNLLVHSFDFDNPDRNRRSIHLITDKNGIKLSSDELRIQFTGVGAEERINIYDGATGKLLVANLQLPVPFFTEKSNKLYFGFYPQSIWNGPVMTVPTLQAASS